MARTTAEVDALKDKILVNSELCALDLAPTIINEFSNGEDGVSSYTRYEITQQVSQWNKEKESDEKALAIQVFGCLTDLIDGVDQDAFSQGILKVRQEINTVI